MNPELEGYLEQIRYVRQDIAALVANLADDQFAWRPGRDRWSIEHDVVSTDLHRSNRKPRDPDRFFGRRDPLGLEVAAR